MNKLKEIAVYLIAKLVTPENVAKLYGMLAARMFAYARKSGHWETVKSANHRVADISGVIDRVYEDDTLTAEEEAELGRVLAEGLDPRIALTWLFDREDAKKQADAATEAE